MNTLRPLKNETCSEILSKILREFGDGTLPPGGYVFDAITRLPVGYTDRRDKWTDLVHELSTFGEICAIFDPSPKNAPYVNGLLSSLQLAEAPGLVGEAVQLAPLVAEPNCDLYFTTQTGELLAVASHEDEFDGPDRIMWRTIKTRSDG